MKSLICLALVAICLPAPAACADDGMPKAVRKTLNERLIGDWTTEFKVGDEVSKGTYVAKWSPGKQSIRIQMVTTGKEGTRHASELMGWDADAENLVIFGFGAQSASWTLRFTDLSSDIWKGRWKGFFNGKVDGSSCTMELKGDSFEYRDTTDGQSLVIKAVRK